MAAPLCTTCLLGVLTFPLIVLAYYIKEGVSWLQVTYYNIMRDFAPLCSDTSE